MPARLPYVGTAGVASSGYPSIPIQTETQTFLSRFSTAPSATFKNALNQAIYRWKRDSVYSLISDLWIFCADTQADALRNFATAARDATITGSPTFTALKGFGGFGASNYISLPLGASSTQAGFFGGKVNGAGATAPLIGSSISDPAAVVLTAGGWGMGGTDVQPMAVDGVTAGLVGQVGTRAMTASTTGQNRGTGQVLPASPITTKNGDLRLASVYGFLSGTPTADQVRAFLATLNSFVADIGALS